MADEGEVVTVRACAVGELADGRVKVVKAEGVEAILIRSGHPHHLVRLRHPAQSRPDSPLRGR